LNGRGAVRGSDSCHEIAGERPHILKKIILSKSLSVTAP
jgi:hypothetical protein